MTNDVDCQECLALQGVTGVTSGPGLEAVSARVNMHATPTPRRAYAIGGRSTGTEATLRSVATRAVGASPKHARARPSSGANDVVATCAWPQCSACAVCPGRCCVPFDDERSSSDAVPVTWARSLSAAPVSASPPSECASRAAAWDSTLLSPASPSCTSGKAASSTPPERASATNAVRNRRSTRSERKARSMRSGTAVARTSADLGRVTGPARAICSWLGWTKVWPFEEYSPPGADATCEAGERSTWTRVLP